MPQMRGDCDDDHIVEDLAKSAGVIVASLAPYKEVCVYLLLVSFYPSCNSIQIFPYPSTVVNSSVHVSNIVLIM